MLSVQFDKFSRLLAGGQQFHHDDNKRDRDRLTHRNLDVPLLIMLLTKASMINANRRATVVYSVGNDPCLYGVLGIPRRLVVVRTQVGLLGEVFIRCRLDSQGVFRGLAC